MNDRNFAPNFIAYIALLFGLAYFMVGVFERLGITVSYWDSFYIVGVISAVVCNAVGFMTHDRR